MRFNSLISGRSKAGLDVDVGVEDGVFDTRAEEHAQLVIDVVVRTARSQGQDEDDIHGWRLLHGNLQGPDLMSVMSTAERGGRRFSDEEIVVYCRFLLPGGIETTWRQTANVCLAMLTHPDQYRQVVADPRLVEQAIEECCRWLPSGFVLPRIAANDVELAGVTIPAGSAMTGMFGIANRDPRIWANPDSFDIHRDRLTHLTFSMGSHGCMGQHLARQNLQWGLRTLIRDLPDSELACDPAELATTGFVIRCPTALPVV